MFKRIAFLLLFLAAGCATARPQAAVPMPAPGAGTLSGRGSAMITHTVAPKETLWSISKRYGVSVDAVARTNKIASARQLPVGTTLLIPEPLSPSSDYPPLPSIPLYPNPRWRYIVIHHSATNNGNAKLLDRAHRRRGFSRGLGYHFVINNGTSGKRDGEIEIGSRWRKQEEGAHCNAGGMNQSGIGICIVGDFTTHPISQAQMASLTKLVNQLQRYYGVSPSRIIRHRDVPGKATACPGNHFPWAEFRRRLSKQSLARTH